MVDPGKPLELESDALALLRQAGLERDDIGERLARHEYIALRKELAAPGAFSLQVELGSATLVSARDPMPQLQQLDLEVTASQDDNLPVLPVPLGRIAWAKRPESLPVVGILIAQPQAGDLGTTLQSLLAEHHQKPFARLVFLSRGLEPVHVLGRYGFVIHDIGQSAPDRLGPVLAHRYGMSQIRDLRSGQRLWSSV